MSAITAECEADIRGEEGHAGESESTIESESENEVNNSCEERRGRGEGGPEE